MGAEVLATMVLVGHALPAEAHDRGGPEGEGPPDGGDELLHAPDHERRGRGPQLEDRHHPEDGVWVPEQGPLPNRGSVPMWGPTALPGDPHDSRMNLNSVGSEQRLGLGVGQGAPGGRVLEGDSVWPELEVCADVNFPAGAAASRRPS